MQCMCLHSSKWAPIKPLASWLFLRSLAKWRGLRHGAYLLEKAFAKSNMGMIWSLPMICYDIISFRQSNNLVG